MTLPTLPIYADNPGSLPASYRLPDSLDLIIESVTADIDGAAASGAFILCLSVYSQDNRRIGRVKIGTAFAVGDTGVVTFAPFLRSEQAAASGIAVLAYAEITASVTITGTTEAAPTTVVTTPAYTYDGSTRVKVEHYAGAVDVTGGGTDIGVFLNLWQDSADIGRFGYLDGRNLFYTAGTSYSVTHLTPAAGSHTYSARYWKQHPATTAAVYAEAGGAGLWRPAWIAVTEAPL